MGGKDRAGLGEGKGDMGVGSLEKDPEWGRPGGVGSGCRGVGMLAFGVAMFVAEAVL